MIDLVIEVINSQGLTNSFAFITVIVTLSLYYKSYKNKLRQAATIIILELREAEKSIKHYREIEPDFYSSLPILPNNSWQKFNYLFIKYFDRDELKYINDFYFKAKIIENERINIKNYFILAMEEKSKCLQQKLIEHSSKDRILYEKEKKITTDIAHEESYWLLPNKHRDEFVKYLNEINLITTTPVYYKLKKIAKFK